MKNKISEQEAQALGEFLSSTSGIDVKIDLSDPDADYTEEEIMGELNKISNYSEEEEKSLELLPEKEKPKKEKKERKINKKRLRITVICSFFLILILSLIGTGCFLMYRNAHPKVAEVIPYEQTDEYINGVNNETIKDLKDAANKELIGSYEFLLHGQYKATCAAAENGLVYFNFFSDGSYSGYMTDNEMAEGIYRVEVEKDQYVLEIVSGKKLNKYTIEFNDTGNIKLVGFDNISPGTYVLF